MAGPCCQVSSQAPGEGGPAQEEGRKAQGVPPGGKGHDVLDFYIPHSTWHRTSAD